VTVSGSFRKHWNEIDAARNELHALEAAVLSPLNGPPLLEREGFTFLRADAGSPAELELRHLSAIRKSDLLYIVNPGGYLGSSVALEIGYALAWDIPIWSSEPFADSPHHDLVRSGSVHDALDSVRDQVEIARVDEHSSLDSLQAYMKSMAAVRGFDAETPEQVLILLVEEVGELAKAMRARLGLLMSAGDRSEKSIRLELADCLIYVLHMANQTGVRLISAFKEKERLNSKIKWSSR
jgi:NTP pyrophosphatase (non-canonical NTP hydrolase)